MAPTTTALSREEQADIYVSGFERAREREVSGVAPGLARFAGLTPEQLDDRLLLEWESRNRDGHIDPFTTYVPAALNALDGTDTAAQAGAAAVLVAAYRQRYGPATLSKLEPLVTKARESARHALRLTEGYLAPLVAQVAEAMKRTDPESMLMVSIPAGEYAALRSKVEADIAEARRCVVLALRSVYPRYTEPLADLETKLGFLDVPRISPSALCALEAALTLDSASFAPARRAATLEALKALIAALGYGESSWWTLPSTWPTPLLKREPTPTTTEKRGGVLGRLGLRR